MYFEQGPSKHLASEAPGRCGMVPSIPTPRAPEYGGDLRSPYQKSSDYNGCGSYQDSAMLGTWGSQRPGDTYTYTSPGRTANSKKTKTAPITTDWALVKTAACWGHGDLIPHGPEAGNRNRRP